MSEFNEVAVEQQQQQPPAAEWIPVATEDLLRRYTMMRVDVSERKLLLVVWKGVHYALDNFCYHSGGPLDQGEIEEIEELGRRPCVVCPWHKYKITLDTGEGIYKQIDPFVQPRCEVTKTKGVKQRTHQVKVDNGQVFIKLNLDGPDLPCDYYSSESFRNLMNRASRQQTTPQYEALAAQRAAGGGGGVPMHSTRPGLNSGSS